MTPFSSSARDRETREELAFHLERETEKLIAQGHSPEEARRLARLAFGSVPEARESARDARGGRWLDDLVRDFRHALVQLRRGPAFAAVTVLTIALGIGANTAILSVVDGVLLRPSPFREADRLVVAWQTDTRTGTIREPMSWPDYRDFLARGKTLAGLAGLTSAEVNLAAAGGEPARLTRIATTANYFGLVGVAPILGRSYSAAEDLPGGPPVALVSERLWRTRFGADPGIIGRTIRLDDVETAIIGVLPGGVDFGLDQLHARAAYHGSYAGAGEVDVWSPLQADEARLPRDTHPILAIGRLAPGATMATASEELVAIATELERTYPRSNTARGLFLEPFGDMVFGPVRPVLGLLLGAVALVLLVASVNVANLLLARGATRAREVAVRSALGADFGRLGRQFAVESVVLALLGGLAGVGLALGGLDVLLALAPADLPRVGEVGIDGRVLLATLAISLVVGIGFGLVPTFQARGVDVAAVMKNESRGTTGHGRLRRGLVVAELALSVTLVVSAGLLIRSFRTILATDPGFRTERILKAEYQLPPSRYPRDFSRFPNWPEIHRFHTTAVERARAIPGVEAAAVASAHPLNPGFTNSFTIVGREAEARGWPEISIRGVSAEYPATLGLRLAEGRTFAATDGPGDPPVALINETAARRFFPDGSPLGHEIRFWGIARRIVGVLGDERIHGMTQAAPPAVYVPTGQIPPPSGVLLVRATGDPTALATQLRAVIRDLDPELAVYGIEPLATTLLGSLATRRFAMLVMTVFAGLTLVLALIGVHGVLAYLASTRSREIGIRVALGASAAQVRGLMFKEGLTLAATGIGVGVLGALAGSRLLGSLLHGVTGADPLTYLAVTSAVLAAAALATWLPARSAARVPPVEALRSDG